MSQYSTNKLSFPEAKFKFFPSPVLSLFSPFDPDSSSDNIF